jgi:hypothetical protein
MRHANPARLHQQVSFLRRQVAQDDDLPFSDVLAEDLVRQALTTASVSWIDRIFSPLVTLWVFLSQVLSADHSCRAAVARLIAHRLARGQKPCSAKTGAYCQARDRLPEPFYAAGACSVGRALDSKAEAGWLWKGRRVYLFDGTTVSMPDTAANQEAFPQVYNQKPGAGFPIARVAAIISLSCGAILHLGVCKYAGKGQGEVSLLRTLWDALRPHDILLTDAWLANGTKIGMPQQRGIALVGRLNTAHRTADFRRGKRLGTQDHIVRWLKPTAIRSLDRPAYQALPESITVREVKVRVTPPGFRTKALVVVTTSLDPRRATEEELASLYRSRWNNELDPRSIKSTMQLRDLRCKTPELVRKEVWTHVLAYNLIRALMAQAAAKHTVVPRSIRVKGTIQTPEAFQPTLALQASQGTADLLPIDDQLLRAIATHRVGDRPDRFEPRAKKHRRNHYGWLTKPRSEVKRKMAKGVIKN